MAQTSFEPFVRIEDATLVHDDGPVRLVVSHVADASAVADALARAGGRVRVVEGRLWTVSTPSRVVDAAGRAGGADLANSVEAAISAALDAWLRGAPDLETSCGVLPCSTRPVVMGVVNVTPDSFSDGGRHFDPDDPAVAVAWARELAAAGSDILDIGGESTRPGADAVSEEEELRRVVPVVEALAADGHVVSVDTTKAGVARAAVAAGAAIVNDVSAGALDGLMLPTIAELGVPYVAMHMRGTPRTMQRDPRYADVVAEVFDFLAETVIRVAHLGIDRERVVIDPGIGFGKTVAHNLELLRRLREFTSIGRPLLIGTSRKSFLGTVTGVSNPEERVVSSVVTAAQAVTAGASIVRVHDVAETVLAVRIAHAVATGHWPDS